MFGLEAISCATSSRSAGNMSLSYGDTKDALLNRKAFLSGLGIDPGSIICAEQTHSDHIRRVGNSDRGKGSLDYASAIPDTDAFVTDVKGLALAVFTADCLPVFLYDPASTSIGLVHAGWRGVFKEIAPKTVRAMKEYFGSRPEDIRAGFGPAIRSCCFQVQEELKSSFPKGLILRGGAYYLDFISLARQQLLDSGLKEENILDCVECTCCAKDEYFSFRREKDSAGRMISVAVLR